MRDLVAPMYDQAYSALIEDLIENARQFMAMSPNLREAVARVDAQRAARASSIGGAQ